MTDSMSEIIYVASIVCWLFALLCIFLPWYEEVRYKREVLRWLLRERQRND